MVALHPDLTAFLANKDKNMLIDGVWAAAETGERLPVVNPATEETIATVPAAGPADVNRAVAAARRALEDGRWSGLPPAEREKRLLRLADLLEAHAEEMAQLIVLENGKLLAVARQEVAGSARYTRYMAGWATKITGDTIDVSMRRPDTEFFAYTRREPVGVVAAIIPWNVPLTMTVWKTIPALVCGCTVVLKPSEETPLCALRYAELAQAAGVPDGALNVITGAGDPAGAALVAHRGVDKISFTGSTATGKKIGRAAMDNLTRVSLELGGKSPVIVLDDADMSRVPRLVAGNVYRNQGQICAAGTRLYVPRARYEPFLDGVAAFAGGLKIGSGLEEGVGLGPVVSRAQRERVLGYIASGLADGAELVAGGKGLDGTGYFVQPTVLANTDHSMRVVREEIFGPVLVAQPYDDLDEVIGLANDTDYGLAAYIYSESISRVNYLIPRIQAGIVYVNAAGGLDPSLPFGGFKQSGIGREHGRAMIDLYTELKTVLIGY